MCVSASVPPKEIDEILLHIKNDALRNHCHGEKPSLKVSGNAHVSVVVAVCDTRAKISGANSIVADAVSDPSARGVERHLWCKSVGALCHLARIQHMFLGVLLHCPVDAGCFSRGVGVSLPCCRQEELDPSPTF